MGMPTTRPVVEMTIPSAVDPTLAPKGKHVVQLFVQYAPYDMDPKFGSWGDAAFTVRVGAGGMRRTRVPCERERGMAPSTPLLLSHSTPRP